MLPIAQCDHEGTRSVPCGAQIRGYPRNCRRRAGSNISIGGKSGREGWGLRVRAVSQETYRRRSSGRARGIVFVSFGISTSGGLRYARIGRSSGNCALDRAALTAVREVSPCPQPARAMTSRQLSYAIPFRFR